MPQFSIYKNPGRNEDIPFVVQIQSTRLDDTRGRVVMPLVRRGVNAPPNHGLTPHLTVLGQAVYANPLDIVAVPRILLKESQGKLPERDQDAIIQAIDEMISRA